MRTLPLLTAVERLEDAKQLDPLAGVVRGLVKKAVRPRWLRDVLHGVPLGHPLHPLMVQVPLGAWISAAVLDCLPGAEKQAAVLVGLGLATAGPSALAGYVDFSELHEQHQRIGVIHSTANAAAVGLYSVSLFQRLTGKPGGGRMLGFLGLGVVSAGGWLGGHLAFRQAAGANHAEDVPHRIQPGWQRLVRLDELTAGRMERRMLGSVPLLVLRTAEGKVNVLSDTCSHLSGPLSEGTLQIEGGVSCVMCPWHMSVFSLETGDVMHGPATSPQPSFRTRITEGTVEVCLPGAG
ncbi:Rieske 2Fe-2S domain-containing protein [Paenarthrobacter sp. PH39-S1]|uniref:Rieske 2Fe-2S domain-containing protein n=1 Tax=Paenarthrobacter sp. PH39-S1 TaxID=3046204 RepID=UPI0024BBC4B4|nr:Rieske 2Fe-2S domain-containing protein [Paenarthrobacter sp. PH39-S1]MDJ0358371.1 Rieske 2Fe-2S domain-containing protein [Paenarthrobacter sp. PH39-S1]